MTSSSLSPQEAKTLLLKCLQEKDTRESRRLLSTLYPETGPLRRELYPKHLAFFKAGATHRERCFMAANRIGKTLGLGGYETALHLTGKYPEWWEGRRFRKPTKAWAAGDTTQTVRDILQEKLIGPPGEFGTGLIPGECLNPTDIKMKAGNVPDAVESVLVRHISGGRSRLVFKSYDQKRKAFQGTEQDVIWLDEECPISIYSECLIRTMTTNGLILLTFTPLMGLTETVLNFMPGGRIPDESEGSKFIIQATWEDAPHLTEQDKKEILAGTAPHLRKARSKGIPHLGAGAIYPIAEEEIVVDDFEIPIWFYRCFGFDVGWNATAAAWLAHDRDSDIVYVTSVYKQSRAEPVVHAQSVLLRGDWIPGVIDPAAKASSQRDGQNLFYEYRALIPELYTGPSGVEAGILAIWQRMTTGRFKVFKSCVPWFEEYRIYRRDEEGHVVKSNDHILDATRYAITIGLPLARQHPDEDYVEDAFLGSEGRNPDTGY